MALYFISDLHLDAARPDVSAAFFSYLQHLPQDAEHLYILGDFFEVWIGDDAASDLAKAVIDALAKLTHRGIPVSFLHGNRDFLVGADFARDSGISLLSDPYLLSYRGHGYLLLHGDSLCTSDTRYMAFRAQVRDPAWQAAFLGKPIEERAAIARALRENSRKDTAQKDEYITDVTPEAVVDVLRGAGVTTLIHGHTHRPAVHRLQVDDKPATRYVLGDWDRFGFDIRIDGAVVELRRFALDDAQAAKVIGA